MARFYFKDVTGAVVDEFLVQSSVGDGVAQATLARSVEGAGAISLDPPGGVYDVGTLVTLTAQPAAGYAFAGWTGDLSGSGNPATLLVDADTSVGAVFVRPTVEVSTGPNGAVTLDPPGGVYDAGSVVTLTATPAPGYEFAGWGGDLAGTDNPAALVVDRDRRVGAWFDPLPATLEELRGGASNDRDTVATDAPLAAAEGDLYLAAVAFKPNVAVTGVSGLGLAWSPVAAQCGARGQTGVALWHARGQPLHDEAVTATLASAPRAAVITVARYSGAEGTGALASGNTRGVTGGCSGGTDSAAYALDLTTTTPGSRVQVAVAMRNRDHMPGPAWSEQVESYAGSGGSAAGLSVALGSAQQPALVSVDGSFNADVDWAVVAAEVRRPAALLSLSLGSSPGGSVSLAPPGGVYEPGTAVTLTVTPDPGRVFSGWGGDLSDSENPTTLVMDDHKSVTALFEEGGVPTVSITPSAGGSIALDPPQGAYPAGTIVGVTATPDAGFLFRGWTGDLGGSENPTLLLVDAHKTIGAVFDRPILDVTVGPNGSVTLDPPGGVYDLGSVVTLEAVPEAGYRFVGWVGDLSGAQNPTTLLMDTHKTIGAAFERLAVVDIALEELESGASVQSDTVATDAPLAAVDDHLYLAAVATKPHEAVTDVSGLGLAWSPVAAQCGGRGQTGVALWQARGQPLGDGSVSATLASTTLAAVITVSRYAGAEGTGALASANTQGVAGGCSGGTDDAAYAFDLETTTPNSRVLVAVGMRNRNHEPGPAWSEQAESYAGSGGSTAGLSVASGAADQSGAVTVDGGFNSDVDWAVVAAEVRPLAAPALASLSIGESSGGSVTLDPPGGAYELGSVVTITAVREAGHAFAGWVGDLAGSSNPTTLVMDSDKTVSASFVPAWWLRVMATSGGSVVLDPPEGVYAPGTQVTLTALPDAGHLFTGWFGDLAGTQNPATLVVDADKQVGAIFEMSTVVDIALEEVQSGSSEDSDTVATDAPLTAAAGQLYLAAIAFKPDVIVTDVSGLGLAWEPVAAQCAGRSQTGVALWQARGQPQGDGVVTASFASAPRAAAITVSRYAGAGDTGVPVSANSRGLAGSCSGGTDGSAYAFDLDTTAPGSQVHVAVAMRNRSHEPGAGWSEQAESFAGGGGSAAGLAVATHSAEQPGRVSVEGSFDGDVDWAAVAVEVLGPSGPQ
jgi:hypothetical protein